MTLIIYSIGIWDVDYSLVRKHVKIVDKQEKTFQAKNVGLCFAVTIS